MSFNKEIHAALTYVDKPYKELLTKIRKQNKRTEKAMLEHLIEKEAKGENNNE